MTTAPAHTLETATDSGLFVVSDPSRAAGIAGRFLTDAESVADDVDAQEGLLIEAGFDGVAVFDLHVLDDAPAHDDVLGWALDAKRGVTREGRVVVGAPETLADAPPIRLGEGPFAVAVRPNPRAGFDYSWGLNGVAVSRAGDVGMAIDAGGAIHILELPSLESIGRVDSRIANLDGFEIRVLDARRALVLGAEARVVELDSGRTRRVGRDCAGGLYELLEAGRWAFTNGRDAQIRIQSEDGKDQGALKGSKVAPSIMRWLGAGRLLVGDATNTLAIYDVETRQRVLERRFDGPLGHIAIQRGDVWALVGDDILLLAPHDLSTRTSRPAGPDAMGLLPCGASLAVLDEDAQQVRWLDEDVTSHLRGTALSTACTDAGVLLCTPRDVIWIPRGGDLFERRTFFAEAPEGYDDPADFEIVAWPITQAG